MEYGATFKEMRSSSVEDRISCLHPDIQDRGFNTVNEAGAVPPLPGVRHPPHPLASSGCSRLALHNRLRCSDDVTTHLTKQG